MTQQASQTPVEQDVATDGATALANSTGTWSSPSVTSPARRPVIPRVR
jgi:hypothetical protein